MKIVLLVLVLIAGAVATLPWWGSCDLNYQACSTWCSVANFNSDVGKAGCKAECATRKGACLAKQGAEGIGKALEGLGK